MLAFLASLSDSEFWMGLLVGDLRSVQIPFSPSPMPRHKEEVYENVHSKNKKEEKVKKQRSADKEKSKGSLKRK